MSADQFRFVMSPSVVTHCMMISVDNQPVDVMKLMPVKPPTHKLLSCPSRYISIHITCFTGEYLSHLEMKPFQLALINFGRGSHVFPYAPMT
jgi:hypothetical protein